ncbi:hypothetical protein EJ03DRAFT_354255 [Teratosphaeria nubilosa]|uniref:Secreted protein n=1 Tax=Teratosphaeria nubilosa TaxID=161662 RepID=A0A6G1KZL1_9PEZI|nr:hypothetical protein EJ03DRAFT_354255 [Teratosphaeria nubilosa]
MYFHPTALFATLLLADLALTFPHGCGLPGQPACLIRRDGSTASCGRRGKPSCLPPHGSTRICQYPPRCKKPGKPGTSPGTENPGDNGKGTENEGKGTENEGKG